MQEQRTIITHHAPENTAATGLVTVAAFGVQRQALPGKTVAETLQELGLSPQPYQSVRVGGVEVKVKDLEARRLAAGEVVTLTNLVRGG